MSMRKKYSGSVVRANPVVPTEDSASGIWTLDQQNQNQKRGTWPFVGDPNFKDTVLLLHGDTSQTPSSEDQSSSNHEVTIAGDSKATNWSPFNLPEGYWSNFFDGTDDYYSVPNSTNTNIGGYSEDYTINCWFNLGTITSDHRVLFGMSNGGGAQNKWLVGINMSSTAAYSANKVGIYSYANSSARGDGTYSPGFLANSWYYFTLVYTHSNTTLKIYINGTEVVSVSSNVDSSTGAFTMGADGEGNGDFNGFISNIRLIKGTALDSTVPTTPLTAVTNTKLLTAQSNRFVDNSSSPLTITITGTPKVQPFSPFSYTPTTTVNNYGSYYFDGTGDYLSIASNEDFKFGTEDFTIEMWVYAVKTTEQAIYDGRSANGAYPYILIQNSSNKFIYYVSTGVRITANDTVPLYQWVHLAIARSGTTTKMFVNGTQQTGTYTDSTDYGQAPVYIGQNQPAGGENFEGYISNLRVIKGNALYTSSFTVPTKPVELTLTEGENSVYFDGTGDYLNVTYSSSLNFGTGDFTIEFWAYQETATDYTTWYSHGYISQSGNILLQSGNNSSNIRVYLNTNSPQITSSSSLTLNAWTHVALVRSSGQVTLYFNGVSVGTSSTSSINLNETSDATIGMGDSSHYLDGYISNMRLTAKALYTGTFTPPDAPFSGTTGVLLACASRYIEDRSPQKLNVAANGNAVVSGFNPFNEGYWSNYFDGSGDYFQVNSFSHTLSGQWSWECWVYKLDTGVDVICSDNSLDNFQVALTSPNISFQYGGSERFNVSTGFNQNVWYHICITRDGSNNIRCFINGVLKAYVASMSSNPVLGVLNIGRQDNSGSTAHPTYAYLSNLRFVIGSIPTGYQTSETSTGTSIFTSPTDVLTTSSQGATSSDIKLLTCQSNRFLDNSASSHGITVSGNTSIDESIPFQLLSRQTKLLAVHNNQDVNNNSFQDSSLLKNFITRTGNVAQGTFSPFSAEDGYWSVFIDDSASAARLEFLDSADFAFASGQAFTVECFIYLLQKTAGDHIYMTAANGGFALKIDSTGNNLAAGVYSGNEPSLTRVKGAVSIGTWHHIVYVRDSSNTASFFVDGTRTETTTDNTNYAQQAARVGCTTVNPCHAYINNLRVTRSEVYDASSSSLTVPTIPLSALANTVLLTCQSNRFVDNSSDARVPSIISSNNTPKVQPYAPFAPRRSYSKEVVGGSAYFDGTGDRLTVVDGASIGAGDFTISAWVYRTSNGTFPVILDTRSADGDTKPVLYTEGSNLYYYTSGGIRVTGSSAINNNEWIFVRLVKESNVTKLFVNGTQVGSNYSDSNNYVPTNDWEIGSRHTDQHYWPGYISNLQVVLSALDGTSVPTAPFTSDENTRLLLNSTDGAVIDNTGKNNFETQDNTIVSPYIKKFGNGSVLFSGETLEITTTTNPNLALGSGEFTVEFWFYSDTASATQGFMGSYSAGWWFQYFGNWQFGYSNTAIINHTQAYNAKQWYFIAVTRDSSNVVGLYIDGTRVSNATNTTDLVVGSTFAIGGIDTSGTRDATAKLDEVRITKGVARYTGTSHVVPIRAFKNR